MIPYFQATFTDVNAFHQQDNAPCHKSRQALHFFNSHKISIMDWPSHSPDLNLIENLWGILKKQIARTARLTKESVIESTDGNWRDDDLPIICNSLAASMPRRIRQCIRNKGGAIDYKNSHCLTKKYLPQYN